ncbi:penicillin acylase family protein [Elstera cyanobacteriorum]|uniref:penicillin acylase family protein n=1 Tax=Elstera cyanobacteriorum TaxID=2022747 RepID=UPI00235486A4|nr:penicillin acylase family protein [Elstera cyanobacteriorum]MCK6443529.1 penicillin acylase family protein [Elstera cyanobacteriorum]
MTRIGYGRTGQRIRGRRWGRLLIGVLLVPVLALAALWFYLRTGLPEITGRVAVAGLQHEVGIYRDRDGVPHIFARTAADGYRALGYVHAQDRLFQMDLMRRVASGRLAEAIGSMGLENDRFMRTLGLRALAARDFVDLSAETRAALIAYAEGVNSYLYQRKGALPPEYLVFPAPESWTPTDSLLWGKLMGMALSGNWRDEAVRARMRAQGMPQATVDLLFGLVGGQSQRSDAGDDLWRQVDPAMRKMLAGLPPLAEPRTASNAWAVAGSRTDSGKPLLASDPHLSLTAPSLWYLARIVTGDGTLVGATAPGVPFLVLGHNGRLAWGLTTTGADTQDLVLERLTEGSTTTVDRPQGDPDPIETHTETIRVRWSADEIVTVRRTANGPILSDLPALTPGLGDARTLVALHATFLQPGDRSADALLGISTASDWGSFTAAASVMGAPMQNFIMATDQGSIGMISAARIPLRRQSDGWMPMPGWERSSEWAGFAPVALLPQTRDPAQGYVANANNALVSPDYPVMIAQNWDDSFRGDRLAEQLDQAHGRRRDDEAALQMDTTSLFARRLIGLMEGWEPPDPAAAKALKSLRAWDKQMRQAAREPLLFAEFSKKLMENLLADDLAALVQDGGRPWRPRSSVLLTLLRTESPLCDTSTTPTVETCRDQLSRALAEAERAVGASATWGEAHRARHDHPAFGRIPVLGRLFGLSVPADGGNDTLQRMAYRGDSFDAGHGAGYRAVYDLADLDRSGFIISTGQSGHRLSPFYDTFLTRARDGELRPLTGTPSTLARSGATLLTLTPP